MTAAEATVQQVKLTSIRTDGSTQPRVTIQQGLVHEYLEAYQAGADFPPIVLFYDGTDFWAADGFHRLRAADQAGKKTIAATVYPGSLEDAQWHSYSVNQTHGARRTNADKEAAVMAALGHANASRMSDGAIAEHCGVSSAFVGKLRKTAINGLDLTERIGRDGKTYDTANIGKKKSGDPKAPAEDSTPPSAQEAEPPPAEAASEPPPPPPAKPAPAPPPAPTDQTGEPLPANGRIRDAFARRGEITAMMTTIAKLKGTVLRAVTDKDPLFRELVASTFQAAANTLHHALRAIRPHAVCPYCGGEGCKACHKRGWLGEFSYKNAPSEMKRTPGASGEADGCD